MSLITEDNYKGAERVARVEIIKSSNNLLLVLKPIINSRKQEDQKFQTTMFIASPGELTTLKSLEQKCDVPMSRFSLKISGFKFP